MSWCSPIAEPPASRPPSRHALHSTSNVAASWSASRKSVRILTSSCRHTAMADDRARDDFALEPLAVIDPLGWAGKPIPPREWLWPGWIPMRVVTLLSGHGGAGKSLLAQQMLTSGATGALFLG